MKVQKVIHSPKLKSFVRRIPYKKEENSKTNGNKGSTFIKVSISRPLDKGDVRVKYVQGYGMVVRRKKDTDEFLVEFDNHANSSPHFHIWRVNGYSKVSDTRSPAISLKTGINEGVLYLDKERKKEAKLNDIQEQEIISFVEENRILLYFMYNAFMSGKTKNFNGFDEEAVSRLFSDEEFCALTQKYNLMFNENKAEQTGEKFFY